MTDSGDNPVMAPTDNRDYEWERWRGRVDEWRNGVDEKLTVVSGQLELVLQTIRGSELAEAGIIAESRQRSHIFGWVAPNLASLLSGLAAALALFIAVTHS